MGLIGWRRATSTLALAVVVSIGFGFDAWALAPTRNTGTAPLILEKNEGEHRTRRPRDLPMPSSSFTIKVDRKNGGSQRMWLGTEDLPPGGVIQRHRHLGQDEILLIQTGTAHVSLGTEDRDVHAGAVIFIPSGTWIGLKNIGTEVISLTFVFSDPGFDNYLRCMSVPAGQAASKLTAEELYGCLQQGDFAFEGRFRVPADH
jgi:quercetin dioxygenase-like cupin family protein